MNRRILPLLSVALISYSFSQDDIRIVPYHDYNVSQVIEMDTSVEEMQAMFEGRLKKSELDAVHIIPESGLLAFIRERGRTLGYRAKSHFEHTIKYAAIVNAD